MQVYLVGGAVRDELLGLPVTERDWVVVGATPEAMCEAGYKPVGKDFPVYLHPTTHEEYALARTERKTAPGYKGFSVEAAPEVSLEQDLLRRDLTINAMVKDSQGNIIDPYCGMEDLENRILRHVSPAFCEDPVRILRVARFAARYRHIGFTVADETAELMKSMVKAGEIDALVSERVWAEFVRALSEKMPAAFIEVLRDCGALAILFPELDNLFGVPQDPYLHPEIDAGRHALMSLIQASRLSLKPEVRFAALLHDIGKGVTPVVYLPNHPRHDEAGLILLDTLCGRTRVPNEFRKLARNVIRFHENIHQVNKLSAEQILKILRSLDGLKKNSSIDDFLLACEADARGRKGFKDKPYPQSQVLKKCHTAALSVDTKSLINQGFSGREIGEAIFKLRIDSISECLRNLAPF